jgi:hypothetical protein
VCCVALALVFFDGNMGYIACMLRDITQTRTYRADYFETHQAEICRDIINTWNSKESRCVQRMPTQREIEDKTITYEQIASIDGGPQRKSLLFSAIRSGSVELLTRVLDEFGPCLTLRDDQNFNTALHMAAVKTQRSGPMVQLLVARGHEANTKNRYGWTPLDFARQTKNQDAIEILDNREDAERFSLDIGKDAGNNEDENVGDKVLLDAIRSGQKDLVYHILPRYDKAGSVVDDTNGNSTLHYQVLLSDDPDIVLMLLARGGEVNIRNVQGRTVLNLAETKRRDKSVEVLVRWSNGDDEERREMLQELQNKQLSGDTGMPSLGSPGSRGSPLAKQGSQAGSEGSAEQDATFDDMEEGTVDIRDLQPEEPRPASRDSSRYAPTTAPTTAKSRAWKMDLNDLLEQPLAFADAEMASELMQQTAKEIQELRAKVEMLEQRPTLPSPRNAHTPAGSHFQGKSFDDHQAPAGTNSFGARDSTHQAARYSSSFSRPTTGDTTGAAVIEELFYKMHLMQQKIDRHEMALEEQSQVMTEQQENAIYQINAKMEEITVQQQHAAQMLAETSHKIGSYLQFDKNGAPSQDGKIVITVRAAHGLLHLDAHNPPSPYAVISIDQQVMMTAVAPDTRNPIWEKEVVFDVPTKPSRIVVSVLDRTILGSNRTVLLGKAYISLNLLTDTDMEDWHDLTTDEFGMVRQHAGSVRVKRRFVPTRLWQEFLNQRAYKANLGSIPDELVESHDRGKDANIFGLYIMILKGEGLSSGLPLQNVTAYLQLDQGTNKAESTRHMLQSDIMFGNRDDEVFLFV